MNLKEKMKTTKITLLALLAIALMHSCDNNRDLGQHPLTPDGSSTVPDDIRNLDSTITWQGGGMRLQINPTTVRANDEDQATVRLYLYDDHHNPISGQGVLFSSSLGLIQSTDTTDANGIAEVLFTSEPYQGDAIIVATFTNSVGTIHRVAKRISLNGIALSIIPDTRDALVNSSVRVRFRLLDASGLAISDHPIIITGSRTDTLISNGSGEASINLSSATEESISIRASALGAQDTTSIRFWNSIPTTANTQTEVRNIRLFSTRTQLRADNSDAAVITAVLVNERNNPASGDTVFFESNLGIITTFAVVDSTGRASATLQSTAINGTCTVRARAQGDTQDSIQVIFTGLSLQLNSDISSAHVQDSIVVVASMKDASGNAIGGDQVVFQVSGGLLSNGSTQWITQLDGNGQAQSYVSASNPGSVRVVATALNTTDSLRLNFSQETVTLSADRSWVSISGSDSALVTATVRNANGDALSGSTVRFYASSGVIIATAVTNSDGQATAYYKGPDFSGTATIQVVASQGSKTLAMEVRANNATQIELSATPDNISVQGGQANLMATVRDAQGNQVTGQTVSFRILRSPGGGEVLSTPSSLSQTGRATTTLIAGNTPSAYRAVLVEASLPSGAKDTVQLTISGLPYSITVARPQDDTIVVPNAGNMDSTVFRYFVGAVVQDVNGNPVADGTEVHFSATVSGMLVHTRYLVEWKGVNGTTELKPVIGYRTLDVPFEDMNNNMQMDAGIDLKLDYNNNVARRGDDANGDGIMDYNPYIYDNWVDFNNNGICDPAIGEPRYDSILFPSVYADLDRNGFYSPSELITDHNGNGVCDLPASGDFKYSQWEMLPQWHGSLFDFSHNEYSVVISVSATTLNGVAQTALSYPRQFANRLVVTVNAEANGIRDRDGERFALPVILEK